ncbi:DUF1643 domain-containing protein [Heyndrickxia ginsengihumi]|uniref:DUF1643 domain-containing protein n=1 Tax=Heyndrickxia ginsengihumi TaxID=363870 RepID=UPI003D2116EE
MVFLYKDYVKKDEIQIETDFSNNLRYLLEIPLINDSNKTVLVIMKNPSKADQYESDRTINNVLKFCYSKQYSKVYIMNLYSYYSTEPDGIADLIKNNQEMLAIGSCNDLILRQTSQKVHDVIVAWGSNTFGCTEKYKKRIKQVTSIIDGKRIYYVESISKCRWYPKHAQVWSVNNDIAMKSWLPPF